MYEIEYQGKTISMSEELPLLPLRDVVVFPYMIHPLLVGRSGSVTAVEEAMLNERLIMVATQKDKETEEPRRQDIHRVGTIAHITQLLRLPDGTMKILVEGLMRARITNYTETDSLYRVTVEPLEVEETNENEMEALMRATLDLFEDFVKFNKRVPDAVYSALNSIDDAVLMGDTIATHIPEKLELKQTLLEEASTAARLRIIIRVLTEEIEILKLERKIETEVRSQVQKNQREFYLNEQLKAIRRELGQEGDDGQELDDMVESITEAQMPREVEDAAIKEVERLARMPQMSPEASVIRTYLETLIALPWRKRTRDRLDIPRVRGKLDEDHYGLEKVKERIVEFMSVMKLTKRKKTKSPILCFVGPPGVGKTSLGHSIADAIGRKFYRLSLGGVRDEAEIRGHRRTYIGSMPGRIIQALKKAGTRNPVILLDEVDKLGMDFRGDPASALLEVLDPEQNHTFSDHYLEVPFDLSEVLFITTANSLHSIPDALRDRLEIIRLPGYLQHEKKAIAKGFLIPKQTDQHGLKPEQMKIEEKTLDRIIEEYTRESGVRNLEREIASLCRKTAIQVVEKAKKSLKVTPKQLETWLGPPRFLTKEMDKRDEIGIATGLAWTQVGGETLNIEVQLIPGKGEFILTGQLGDVMKESAKAAQTIVRSRAESWGIPSDIFSKSDVHVHVPEGATPKDGPSAGVALTIALVSAITGIPVRHEVAMTGEITLRGNVLAVGGLPEKTVAAQRFGVNKVLLPADNKKDLPELPEFVRKNMDLVFVGHIDDVLQHALLKLPGKKRKGRTAKPTGRGRTSAQPRS
ncbi:MAG: endopeptidase La [bacterium]|nr:endopeptidase La [bacterium]